MNDNFETYLLIITGTVVTQFLETWFGLAVAGAVLILTTIKIVKEIRKWNYDKNRELREQEKHRQDTEMFELELERKRKELNKDAS